MGVEILVLFLRLCLRMHKGQCHVSKVDAIEGVIGGERVDPSCHSLQFGASHWM